MNQNEQVWQQLYRSQYIYPVHFLKVHRARRPASTLPRWPYLSLVVPDLLVELLPLQAEEVFAGRNDATLGCDGAGSVDVVSSNHADCDACALALGDSLGYLQMMSTKAFTDTTKSRHNQTAACGYTRPIKLFNLQYQWKHKPDDKTDFSLIFMATKKKNEYTKNYKGIGKQWKMYNYSNTFQWGGSRKHSIRLHLLQSPNNI